MILCANLYFQFYRSDICHNFEFRFFLNLESLEGDGGHLGLAGNWLKLNLAEDGWKLRDLLEERLARQSTLLQRTGHDRWLWDTDKLNRLLLDGQWLGQAGLNHLLGDAELGRLLVNNVGHASWLVQERNALIQP